MNALIAFSLPGFGRVCFGFFLDAFAFAGGAAADWECHDNAKAPAARTPANNNRDSRAFIGRIVFQNNVLLHSRHDEFVFGMSHGEDRTRCIADDVFRNAAKKDVCQAGAAVRSHRNQVDIVVLCVTND